MDITDYKINMVSGNRLLKAYCSVTFDNQLVVHNIRIVEASGKVLISMPNHKLSDGTRKDYVHPVSKEFRNILDSFIIDKYKKELENNKEE